MSTPRVKRATAQPASSGCTLRAYAAAKKLPEKFLAQIGVREFRYMGAPALHIPYLDEDGTVVAVRFRLELEKGTEGPPSSVARRRNGEESGR